MCGCIGERLYQIYNHVHTRCLYSICSYHTHRIYQGVRYRPPLHTYMMRWERFWMWSIYRLYLSITIFSDSVLNNRQQRVSHLKAHHAWSNQGGYGIRIHNPIGVGHQRALERPTHERKCKGWIGQWRGKTYTRYSRENGYPKKRGYTPE
jgi:hypothetical protein